MLGLSNEAPGVQPNRLSKKSGSFFTQLPVNRTHKHVVITLSAESVF